MVFSLRKESNPNVPKNLLGFRRAERQMNANDGTGFDFSMNDRTCEFMSFYKSSTYGFFKVYVTRDGKITGFAYLEEGHGEAIHLEPRHIGEKEAKEFARALQKYADDLKKWDCNIEEIVFKTRK
jgi:hypothetical protein